MKEKLNDRATARFVAMAGAKWVVDAGRTSAHLQVLYLGGVFLVDVQINGEEVDATARLVGIQDKPLIVEEVSLSLYKKTLEVSRDTA